MKPIFKGKVSAYAGQVEEIFSPAHVSIVFTNRYDIDENAVKDKVRLWFIHSKLFFLMDSDDLPSGHGMQRK